MECTLSHNTHTIFMRIITFTSWCFFIERTSSVTAISSTSPGRITNQRKSIVATVYCLRSKLTLNIVSHSAIGRIVQRRAGNDCIIINKMEYSLDALTFTSWCFFIERTSSVTAISSTSPGRITNQRKSIVATVYCLRSKLTLNIVSHSAIGRIVQRRAGNDCIIINKMEYSLDALTFTSWYFSIKRTSSGTAISSASPCVIPNKRKSSVTTVGSHHSKNIGTTFIK